jgi:hypothetical protein
MMCGDVLEMKWWQEFPQLNNVNGESMLAVLCFWRRDLQK